MTANRPFSSIAPSFATSSSAVARPLYTPPPGVGSSSIGGFQPASTLTNQFNIGTNSSTPNTSSILQNRTPPWQSDVKPVGSFSSIGSLDNNMSTSFPTGSAFTTSSSFSTGTTFQYHPPSQQSKTFPFNTSTSASTFSSFGTTSYSAPTQPGTASLTFRTIEDPADKAKLYSFMAMPEYANSDKSLEEYRGEDYQSRKAGRIQFPKQTTSFSYGNTQSGPSFTPSAYGSTARSSSIKPGTNIFTGSNPSNLYYNFSLSSTNTIRQSTTSK